MMDPFGPLIQFVANHNAMNIRSGEWTQSEVECHASEIEELSKTSFPLCMKRLHVALCKDNHLRYGARLQYMRFLKGMGLPLNEMERFWHDKFFPSVKTESAMREYMYSVRHTYGQEGGRKNYKPFNCMRIIMGSVPPGEIHGCPFNPAHMSRDLLREMLKKEGLGEIAIDDIMTQAENDAYQFACYEHFRAKHPDIEDMDGSIGHPNEYTMRSKRYLIDKKKAKTTPTKKTPTPVVKAVVSTPSPSRPQILTPLTIKSKERPAAVAPATDFPDLDDMDWEEFDFSVLDAMDEPEAKKPKV